MPSYLYGTGVLRVPQHLLPARELKRGTRGHGQDRTRARQRFRKRDRQLWKPDRSETKRHSCEFSHTKLSYRGGGNARACSMSVDVLPAAAEL